MAELLGTVSAGLGLVAITLHAIRSTSTTIGTFTDARASVARLRQELNGLEGVISQINDFYGPIDDDAPIASCLKGCQEELKRLQEMLTSISPINEPKGNLHYLKRGAKKYLKDGDIRDSIIALLSHKLNIVLALQLPRFTPAPGLR